MDTQTIVRTLRENPAAAQQVRDQYEALLRRSATDMEFRRKLLAEPRAAIAEFTGSPVSDSLNVVFVENRSDATVVLPDPVSPEDLADAELEAVAGGTTAACFLGGVALGAAIFRAFLTGYNDGQEH